MKILLTGGNGFLGRNLLNYLQSNKDKYQTLALRRDTTKEQILEFNPSFVFHFAGEIYNKEKMFDSNVDLTRFILQLALKFDNLKGIIILGSSSEYGVKTTAMKESDNLRPNSLYAGTKAASTMLSIGFANEYNLPISVIYPFSVYGYYDHIYKLIPTIYNKIIKEQEIEICTANHDWVFADDFTKLVIQVFEAFFNGDKPNADIINGGTGIQTSNKDVVHIFEKFLNHKAHIKEIPNTRKQDSPTWFADSSYAKKTYGWEATTSLEEGIQKYIKWRDKFLI
jgi:nucleoside-diphosphate-sugar epimerase